MRLILGMHRSGTSLVARVASLVGADLGDPSTFHPADRWNPDGYFEQRSILAVNSALVNGPFGRLSYLLLPSSERVSRRARNHAGAIQDLSAEYADRVVKENRFCLTLHAWRELGLEPERVLLVVRDPLAVARSLKRRDRVPRRIALNLWTEHLRRADQATADLPRRVLWYDHFVSGTAGLEGESEALAWLVGAPVRAVVDVARDVVRITNREPEADLSGRVPDAVARLYQQLTRAAGAAA